MAGWKEKAMHKELILRLLSFCTLMQSRVPEYLLELSAKVDATWSKNANFWSLLQVSIVIRSVSLKYSCAPNDD